MQHCDECKKGLLQEKKVDYMLLGVNLGKYDALVCDSCHETIFTGEVFKAVEKKAREKGLWGLVDQKRFQVNVVG